jgi:hypothetical protein
MDLVDIAKAFKPSFEWDYAHGQPGQQYHIAQAAEKRQYEAKAKAQRLRAGELDARYAARRAAAAPKPQPFHMPGYGSPVPSYAPRAAAPKPAGLVRRIITRGK